MKKTMLILLAALTTLLFAGAATSAVESLRGAQDIPDMSKETAKTKVQVVKGGIERSYKQQPPMVPHKVEKYQIDLKNNGCMKCHSEKTYKKEKAPKAGDSHYVSREGKTLETISSRRYFCNQCHAVQMDAPELVENVFQGTK